MPGRVLRCGSAPASGVSPIACRTLPPAQLFELPATSRPAIKCRHPPTRHDWCGLWPPVTVPPYSRRSHIAFASVNSRTRGQKQTCVLCRVQAQITPYELGAYEDDDTRALLLLMQGENEKSWTMKNPFLSMWLSGMNRAIGSARGAASATARRQCAAMMTDATREAIRFWTAPVRTATRRPSRRKKSR
jgi:hypothetical protein